MAEDSESEPPSGQPDDGSPETADASDAADDEAPSTDASDSELASDGVGDGESEVDEGEAAPVATGREMREDTPYGDWDPADAGRSDPDDSSVDPADGTDDPSADTGDGADDSPFPDVTAAVDAAGTDAEAPSGGDSALETADADATADAEPVAEADAGETADAATPPAQPDLPAADESTDGTDELLDDGLVGEGPASDEEMPLADHIEEMVRRLAVVLVVGGVVGLAVFPIADQVINFLWNAHIPGAETVARRRPRLYGPLELLVTEIKVAALAGFVVGLPVAVYETYLFMRPGLFPRERRYYLAAIPTSLVLALIGVAFAHFVVLPAIFAYFTAYTTGTAVVAFGLKETFSLILVLMGYMALVFQIPLFIMLAIMMNLTTREWLEGRRLLFWGGFLGVAFLVSPDPTGMAPIIVAATMITLFEGTLALLRWTGN
jgi:sec-independent protein translocase protein TatC